MAKETVAEDKSNNELPILGFFLTFTVRVSDFMIRCTQLCSQAKTNEEVEKAVNERRKVMEEAILAMKTVKSKYEMGIWSMPNVLDVPDFKVFLKALNNEDVIYIAETERYL